MKSFRRYIAEQEDNPKFHLPPKERFQKKLPVSGVVIFVKPIVERVEHKYHKYMKWMQSGPKVMRLSVLIRTDEGWILSGKIGKAMNNADVPDVRVGDRIQVDPIQLSSSLYTNAQRAKGIFTNNILQRTLTGKVIRRK
jgi:hypothetical protein